MVMRAMTALTVANAHAVPRTDAPLDALVPMLMLMAVPMILGQSYGDVC